MQAIVDDLNANPPATLPSEMNDNDSALPIFHYRVVSGDTLWSIARRFFANPHLFHLLAQSSGILDPHRIYPGDRITLEIAVSRPEGFTPSER
jgi:nucleoid-associated protein YgaU